MENSGEKAKKKCLRAGNTGLHSEGISSEWPAKDSQLTSFSLNSGVLSSKRN
jgi:hypothetical protein